MHSSTWKAFERRVAVDFGSTRNALSGGNSKVTRSDSLHPRLFISCKHGLRSAFWRLYLEELPKAKKEDKTVILCLGNKNHEGYLVACHSNDLQNLVCEYLISKGCTDLALELAQRAASSLPEKNS